MLRVLPSSTCRVFTCMFMHIVEECHRLHKSTIHAGTFLCVYFSFDYYMVGFWFSIFILSFLTILYIIAQYLIACSFHLFPTLPRRILSVHNLIVLSWDEPPPSHRGEGGSVSEPLEYMKFSLFFFLSLSWLISFCFLSQLTLFLSISYRVIVHMVSFKTSQLNSGRWRTQPELYIHIPEDDVIRHCS